VRVCVCACRLDDLLAGASAAMASAAASLTPSEERIGGGAAKGPQVSGQVVQVCEAGSEGS